MLAIVRYGHGIGLNELKLVYATDTDTTFADGTVQRDIPLVHNPAIWHVSYALLNKKHIVQRVVERDLDALTFFLDDKAKQVRVVPRIVKPRVIIWCAVAAGVRDGAQLDGRGGVAAPLSKKAARIGPQQQRRCRPARPAIKGHGHVPAECLWQGPAIQEARQ